MEIPSLTIKGLKSGPTVLLTACLHGDEIGGMLIIQEIFKILKGHFYRAILLLSPS